MSNLHFRGLSNLWSSAKSRSSGTSATRVRPPRREGLKAHLPSPRVFADLLSKVPSELAVIAQGPIPAKLLEHMLIIGAIPIYVSVATIKLPGRYQTRHLN
jgi:hypothetical protein